MPLVEEDRDIVGGDPVDREREHARAVPGVFGSQDVQPGLVRERVGHARVDRVLLRLDRVEPDMREIIDTGVRPDHSGVVLKACLESMGRGPQRMGLQRGPFHGLPSDEKRPKVPQCVGRGRQDARSRRPEHLVRRDGIEIDPDAVEVDLLVRSRLTAIEEDQSPTVVGSLRDLLDR
jgi:hypothetical protein